MAHHQSPHDTLPSALSSLFESPHHHFLPAGSDDTDMLIDPALSDAAAAAAEAAAAVAAAAADGEVSSHHHTPVGVVPEVTVPDTEAAVAAATALELAEAQAEADAQADAAMADVEAEAAAEAAAAAAADGASEADTDAKAEDLRKGGRGAVRRSDPNGLEVTLHSLRGEHERLRRMIAALEGSAGTAAVAVPDATTTASGVLEGDDLIAQNTLRELATAAVSSGELAGFGFESLQQQLEQQAHDAQTALDDMSGGAEPASSTAVPHSLAGAALGPAEASAGDFLHGLVYAVTEPPPLPSQPSSDPFAITRLALEADIASTRALVAAKEAEIAAFKDGTAAVPIVDNPDRSVLDAQVLKLTTAIDANRAKATVLRDIASRLESSRDALAAEVKAQQDQLADILTASSIPAADGSAAMLSSGLGLGEDTAEGARALLEVRAYVENVLKLWRDKGTLPPAPLPFPLLLGGRDGAAGTPGAGPSSALGTPLQPPPSSLPKKRGRPARAAPKPSVVPPALAHLVPDTALVRAREKEMPIRRKGIKRNKVELEREKQREEEEGEMLRSLVGMGVWTREGGYVDGA